MSDSVKVVFAGKLDRLITIQKNQPIVTSSGENQENWVNYAQVWASFMPQLGPERFVDQADHGVYPARFLIRYRNDIDNSMRIVNDDTLKYRILGVSETGRRAGLEIMAEAII